LETHQLKHKCSAIILRSRLLEEVDSSAVYKTTLQITWYRINRELLCLVEQTKQINKVALRLADYLHHRRVSLQTISRQMLPQEVSLAPRAIPCRHQVRLLYLDNLQCQVEETSFLVGSSNNPLQILEGYSETQLTKHNNLPQ